MVRRVVIDTNVLVSAALVSGSVPDRVLRRTIAGKYDWLVDERILAEYEAVLRRPKFGLEIGYVNDLLTLVADYAERIVADPLPFRLRDRSDEAFLEVAISGGADALVTGNTRDYEISLGKLDLHIVTPRELLELR